jgi:GntR family transcriptional regulator
MKIDPGAQAPLYEQTAAELRRAIADGEVRPGQRMPLAKDLAAVLGVNKNTVLRALRQLRDEGLLEFRRGRGITVTGTPQRGVVMSKVRELVAFGREQGYPPEELIAMIEDISPGGLRCSFSPNDAPPSVPSVPRRPGSVPEKPRR